MPKSIPIVFSYKAIGFFVLLELFTVPMVAMSNSFVIQHTEYIAVMGFVVALVVVYLMLRLLEKFIIRQSNEWFGFQIDRVQHIWYIGIISGILEMIMFMVQDYLFNLHWHDYSAGFWSALISVGLSLLLYKAVLKITGFGVVLSNQGIKYKLNISFSSVLKLSLLLGLYELIVCPITGWWIPYFGYQRFLMAVFSAVIGASCGSLLLVVLTSYVRIIVPALWLILNKNLTDFESDSL